MHQSLNQLEWNPIQVTCKQVFRGGSKNQHKSLHQHTRISKHVWTLTFCNLQRLYVTPRVFEDRRWEHEHLWNHKHAVTWCRLTCRWRCFLSWLSGFDRLSARRSSQCLKNKNKLSDQVRRQLIWQWWRWTVTQCDSADQEATTSTHTWALHNSLHWTSLKNTHKHTETAE